MNLLSTTGMSPVLLSATDDFLFVSIILGGLSIYIFAPLFSLIFLFTRQGRCKWAAIIFTAILFGINILAGYRLLSGAASILPELCLALIATGFWRRIDDRRFPWVSLLWAMLIIRFVSAALSFLLYRVGSIFPRTPAVFVMLSIVPLTVLTTVAGVIILREARRRGLRLPDPVQLIGLGLVATLGCALLSQAVIQLQVHYEAGLGSGVSIPLNWPHLGYSAVSGVLGAILAWVFVQNSPQKTGTAETPEP